MNVLQAEQHGLYATASRGYRPFEMLSAAAEILPNRLFIFLPQK